MTGDVKTKRIFGYRNKRTKTEGKRLGNHEMQG